MTRFAFNATCTVVFTAIMLGLGYWLRHMSVDFNEGFFAGGMLLTALFWFCHKMGVRLF